MDNAAFGRRLKELRQAKGLTQPALAELAGLSRSYLADTEQGRYSPSWQTVCNLADALGVEVGEFRKEAGDAVVAGRGRPVKAADVPLADVKPVQAKPRTGRRSRG